MLLLDWIPQGMQPDLEVAMIKHVILIKLKPEASPEPIDRMIAGYNSMRESIPDLLSWSMGPNLRTAQ
jgi:hypothetical protein